MVRGERFSSTMRCRIFSNRGAAGSKASPSFCFSCYLKNSLCKKTPTTALLSFLKPSFTSCKLLGIRNFESLVFGPFLSKTENFVVFLQALT